MDIDSILKGHGLGASGGSNIKSKQSGKYTLTAASGTVTISTVDLTKAIVRITSYPSNDTGVANSCVKAVLTNATTITFSLSAFTNNATISWEVIEFNNVKSLQTGEVTITTTAPTVTISSVNTAKSLVFFSFTSTDTSSAHAYVMKNGYLSNSTTITFESAYTLNIVARWYVIEFN